MQFISDNCSPVLTARSLACRHELVRDRFDSVNRPHHTQPMPSFDLPTTRPLRTLLSRARAALHGSGEFLRQTGLLWAIDTIAHVMDYGYHLYLGRALPSGAFGQFQSFFSLAMLCMTVAGALHPVAARYSAAPPETPTGPVSRGAILRTYGRQGLLAGAVIMVLLWIASPALARLAALPRGLFLLMALLFPLFGPRGVAMGVLQGEGRFGRLGVCNLTSALVRLILAVVGIGLLGWGLQWAAGTMVLAAAAAFAVASWSVRAHWGESRDIPPYIVRQGWHISLAGLLMAVAYMAITGLDVVWVTRLVGPAEADAYGRVVVLRRVVAVFATAVSVTMLPRVAAAVRAGRPPDRPVLFGLGVALACSGGLTALYALAGGTLYRIAFGHVAGIATQWIPAMALGMMAYSIVLVWLNVYIVADPRPYATVLAVAMPLQLLLYVLLARTPAAAIVILGATGWALALAGAALYVLRLRPRIYALDARPQLD
jgi:O-antigen/teichoic acid export membrane protein